MDPTQGTGTPLVIPPRHRINWPAVMGGTAATLTTIALLWLLGLGITLLAVTPDQIRGGLLALGIITIVVTLFGCLVGGAAAGWQQPSRDRVLGLTHGSLAANVSFLISTLLLLLLFGWVVGAIGQSTDLPNIRRIQETIAELLDTSLDGLGVVICVYMGTWVVAIGLAMAAGAFASVRMGQRLVLPGDRTVAVPPLSPSVPQPA
jgi:hypothetical protein